MGDDVAAAKWKEGYESIRTKIDELKDAAQ
jgi:hypothetical protein